jgi:hypothetical protein
MNNNILIDTFTRAARIGGKRVTRQNLRKAGVVSAMSLAAATVCASAAQQNNLVIATMNAVVTSGEDENGNVFGTKGSLVGKQVRLTYTYDTSKGQQITVGNPGSYSSIASITEGSTVSNPTTATVTIDGHSETLADLPPGATSGSLESYAERQGAPGSKEGYANFFMVEDYGSTSGAITAGIHFNDPSVVPSYDWKSPLSYTMGPKNTSYGSFNFWHAGGSSTKDQKAVGILAITSVAVNSKPIGGPPSLLQLAYASDDDSGEDDAPPGYQYLYDNCYPNCATSGLRIAAYRSNDDQYVIMAVRGTVIGSSQPVNMFKNLFADHSFIGATNCAPSPYLTDAVSGAADFVNRNILALVNDGVDPKNIYLTGHSLGGGFAQILSQKSSLNASVFNAPGGACLYPLLGYELTSLQNYHVVGGTSTNYRLYGDQVSLAGLAFAPPTTMTNVIPNNVLDPIWNASYYMFFSHLMKNIITEVAANAQANPQSQGPNVLPIWENPQILYKTLLTVPIVVVGSTIVNPRLQSFDPPEASDYVFAGKAGAPPFGCILLPEMEGVAAWNIRSKTGSTWSAFSKISGSEQTCFGDAGVNAIEFQPFDSSGKNIVLPDGLLFATSFTQSGTFNGTLTASGTVAAAASGAAASPSTPALNISPNVSRPAPQ